MKMLSRLVAFPVRAPLLGAFWLTGQITKQANDELNSPLMLRGALIEAEKRLLHGEISEAEYDEIEDDILGRLGVFE